MSNCSCTGGAVYRRVTTLIAGCQLASGQAEAVNETAVAAHRVYTTRSVTESHK